MPPKKQLDDNNTYDDSELVVFTAERNAIFEIVQNIYDLTSEINSSTSKLDEFLDASCNIDELRKEFKISLNNYTRRLIEVNPAAKPNYKCLVAFESLYGRIKRIQSQYSHHNAKRDEDDYALTKARPTLPPLELITFSGDIRSWPIFYASFKSAVHDNPSLTDAEKLYYLLGKLTGKALSVCAGISPCADNYELLLQTLIDKYQDKRMLVTAYLNQLFDFKPFHSANASNFDLFTDNFVSAVRALQNLKLDNNLNDLILLHISLRKLDSGTVHAFELSCGSNMPSFDSLVEFVKTRAKVLERTSYNCNNFNKNSNKSQDLKQRSAAYATRAPPRCNTYISTIDSRRKCLCKNITHAYLFKCADFNNNMSPRERFKYIKDNGACINCLSIEHKLANCRSKFNCRVCKQRHHTMLHFDSSRAFTPTRAVAGSPPPRSPRTDDVTRSSRRASPVAQIRRADNIALCATCKIIDTPHSSSSVATKNSKPHNIILLSTAQVIAYDNKGNPHILRVLLDSASQGHFITKECCDRLGMRLGNNERTTVVGFGRNEKIINTSSVNFKIYSRFNNNISFNFSPLVVDQITDVLPSAVVDTSGLSHFNNLSLADDNFATPCKVDALIGASLFPHLLLPGVVRASSDSSAPTAINTVLGYVIMGSVPTISTQTARQVLTCCVAQEPAAIDTLVRRFWELEEPPSASPVQHPADVECEEFYKSTTTRDLVSGRYIVGLPFSDDIYSLGNSYDSARRRFICLERKLETSPNLRRAYDDVIKDYLAKNYISLAPQYDPHDPKPRYIIPHHGVVREDKTTTRLRIVLDASCKTSTGRSLNDILHSGPNLQGDLFKIILNFRLHAVALTADCQQQFLQILVRESDRRFQCFLYRFHPSDPLAIYQFNRVCFGLSSSPYHALRTVKQLIDDDGASYPLASNIASTSLYMDDICFSLPNETEAVTASQQLIELFRGAQWNLVKWNSNSRSVLNNIPASHKLPSDVEFDKSAQHKILGLHWSTDSDTFYFKISLSADVSCTKRAILSTIARLWDIMGFVAPTVVFAKLLLKQLWKLKLDWDDVPPLHIIKMWRQFCVELPSLNHMRIPRHVGLSHGSKVTLLGFSDASENAYGAVIYLHVSTAVGNSVRLVCAKTKVAPTKPLSIARLELCGAVLLSKLLRIVSDTYFHHRLIKTYAFIDSKVALYWIKSSPSKWQTFVANRVVQVTDNLSADNFYHVAGTENPADILSRGITPHKLLSHPLWLHGPQWASLDPSQWPLRALDDRSIEDIPEQRVLSHTVCTPIKQCALYDLALRHSSWSRLLRIIVYICRFAKLLPRRIDTVINADDLNFAEIRILRALQSQYFADEFLNITNNKNCSPVFNRLRPFIDNGLIRVGGRLANSALEYAQMHPVILPRRDHVVNIIVDYYHIKYLHAGPELLMSLLRQKFWILSARHIVRQRVHMCNVCFRLKPRPTYPLMADLPDSRTRQVVKAFTHTGCDYAGPIAYTPVRRRGVRSEKAYICIFTCLTTRAVHIEVTTDLSTPSFIASLKRFLSRRGPVQFMYSDNGTNFKGTNSYLRDLYSFLDKELRPELEREFSENRITWKFICPNSPHFGGAWESMVKVVKRHFFRVVGQQLLSYEELTTVLAQIECILNSRPLTVLSSDPSEPAALTPSHFLYATPLLSLPAHELHADSVNLPHRHSLMDKLVQSFWHRWRMEYLHSLQVRQKWNTPSHPITPGTIAVVMTDNSPPLAWPLAIIEKVHPSKDGVIRVVTVKTARGSYIRPVVRLCPLPKQ